MMHCEIDEHMIHLPLQSSSETRRNISKQGQKEQNPKACIYGIQGSMMCDCLDKRFKEIP